MEIAEFGIPYPLLQPFINREALDIQPGNIPGGARDVVRAADFKSRSRNTPFEGQQLKGRAVRVLVAAQGEKEKEAADAGAGIGETPPWP